MQKAIEHFLDTQKRGLEGTIIKSSVAGWKDGKTHIPNQNET